jgi:hypothetical protein
MKGIFLAVDLPFPTIGVSLREHKAAIPGTGNEPVSLTFTEDIGRYIAAVLKNPDISKNTILRFAGDTGSGNKIVAAAEKHLGLKFEVSYRPAEELDRAAIEAQKTGNFGLFFANRIPYYVGTGVNLIQLYTDVAQLLHVNRPTEVISSSIKLTCRDGRTHWITTSFQRLNR